MQKYWSFVCAIMYAKIVSGCSDQLGKLTFLINAEIWVIGCREVLSDINTEETQNSHVLLLKEKKKTICLLLLLEMLPCNLLSSLIVVV